MTTHIHDLSTRVIELTGTRPVAEVYSTSASTGTKNTNGGVCIYRIRLEHDPEGHELAQNVARCRVINPRSGIEPVTPKIRLGAQSTEGFKVGLPRDYQEFLEYFNLHGALYPDFETHKFVGPNIDEEKTFNPIVVAAVDDVIKYLKHEQSLPSRIRAAYRTIVPRRS
jgi:hypothetical protein